jgi:hypothetical protein
MNVQPLVTDGQDEEVVRVVVPAEVPMPSGAQIAFDHFGAHGLHAVSGALSSPLSRAGIIQ